MLLVNQSSLESLAQFLTALLIFVFVLAITWFTTKYIANFQKQSMKGNNIEIIETTKIAPTKYLQIIRAGEKYLLIAVCKDTVTMLAELPGDELAPAMTETSVGTPDFRAALDKAKQKLTGKGKENGQAKSDE